MTETNDGLRAWRLAIVRNSSAEASGPAPNMRSAKADVFATSSAARQSARAAAATVFEQARQDLFAGMRDLKKGHEAAPMLIRMLVRATPNKAAALRQRLVDLLKDVKAEDCKEKKEIAAAEGGEELHRWSVTIAFARAWPPGKPEDCAAKSVDPAGRET